MKFEFTNDIRLIEDIVNSPYIHQETSDDNTPSLISISSLNMLCIKVLRDTNELVGIFLLEPRNSIHYELHTCLHKNLTVKESLFLLQEGFKWLFSVTTILKVTTYIPTFNIRAKRFATFIGMKEEGICSQSFLKNGILYDQIIMGINKG